MRRFVLASLGLASFAGCAGTMTHQSARMIPPGVIETGVGGGGGTWTTDGKRDTAVYTQGLIRGGLAPGWDAGALVSPIPPGFALEGRHGLVDEQRGAPCSVAVGVMLRTQALGLSASQSADGSLTVNRAGFDVVLPVWISRDLLPDLSLYAAPLWMYRTVAVFEHSLWGGSLGVLLPPIRSWRVALEGQALSSIRPRGHSYLHGSLGLIYRPASGPAATAAEVP